MEWYVGGRCTGSWETWWKLRANGVLFPSTLASVTLQDMPSFPREQLSCLWREKWDVGLETALLVWVWFCSLKSETPSYLPRCFGLKEKPNFAEFCRRCCYLQMWQISHCNTINFPNNLSRCMASDIAGQRGDVNLRSVISELSKNVYKPWGLHVGHSGTNSCSWEASLARMFSAGCWFFSH